MDQLRSVYDGVYPRLSVALLVQSPPLVPVRESENIFLGSTQVRKSMVSRTESGIVTPEILMGGHFSS